MRSAVERDRGREDNETCSGMEGWTMSGKEESRGTEEARAVMEAEQGDLIDGERRWMERERRRMERDRDGRSCILE